MGYEQIAYEVDDRILTITLDRPDHLNAFTVTMLHELLDAFDRADADDEVRAIVVTGRGRAFCAGADLSAGPTAFDNRGPSGRVGEAPPPRDGGGIVALRIFNSTKPVIAAINGPAVGVGLTMTLPMDVRLASERARMGFVFTRRGVVPEACSSWFLPRVVGISRALDWVLSGRVFPAGEAAVAGLVREVVPHEDLLPSARRVAAGISNDTSAVSVALARRMLWRMLCADHPMEAHRMDSRAMAEMGRSGDAHEGVAAFLEKRPAQFRMTVSADLPEVFPGWVEPPFE
ncbi:MAG TPA: crotonase/enoyl-CoA hydratase family protein [Acidimicrobiales bacterium]|jgi:enoyl-CoA hydratase/carnithine racemase|nr:crotonase/enoyl-CoA hydratase family protein [Acidimicrobiales bacterium]